MNGDRCFGAIYEAVYNGEQEGHSKFMVHDGYLFCSRRLRLPYTTLRACYSRTSCCTTWWKPWTEQDHCKFEMAENHVCWTELKGAGNTCNNGAHAGQQKVRSRTYVFMPFFWIINYIFLERRIRKYKLQNNKNRESTGTRELYPMQTTPPKKPKKLP